MAIGDVQELKRTELWGTFSVQGITFGPGHSSPRSCCTTDWSFLGHQRLLKKCQSPVNGLSSIGGNRTIGTPIDCVSSLMFC